MKLETDVDNLFLEITKEDLKYCYEGLLELARGVKDNIDERSTGTEIAINYDQKWQRIMNTVRKMKIFIEKYDKKYLIEKEKQSRVLADLDHVMDKVLNTYEAE